jgi:hypothetical protein
MKYTITILLIGIAWVAALGRGFAQEQQVRDRLDTIKKVLDTKIFVNRFETIESPCLYLDNNDSTRAYPRRATINSNYRVRLSTRKILDPNGVKCLSEYAARYLRFEVKCVTEKDQTLSGNVEITYAYPASSLIQLLGFTVGQPDKNNVFFNKLIRLPGTFQLYPEGEKYRIKLVLTEPPYDKGNAYFGYLEIIRDAFRTSGENVFVFNFDLMSIARGNNNNQIREKFSSTTHSKESMFYSVLSYHVLKNKTSPDLLLRAKAIWLENFLQNRACPQCKMVYFQAVLTMFVRGFSLPNTSPDPAH